MRIFVISCIILFIYCMPALADEEMLPPERYINILQPTFDFTDWSDFDKILLTTSTTLLVMDWRQSHEIALRGLHDLNPILHGQTPEFVDVYFIICIIGNIGIAENLLPEYRPYWLFFITAVESYVVYNNAALGVSVSF